MHYVYVIQSIIDKSLYFGITNDLSRRLLEHNDKKNFSTSYKGPWRYVYIEGYLSRKDAALREKIFKHYGNARTYVKRRLKNSLSA